jgi:Kdo2-lipid IVA lauroyltransferase/acyltransferase
MLPAALRVLPESWGRAACAGLGRLGHATVERDRILARANLARVHPEWTEDAVNAAARRVFEEIGRNAYDFVRYPDLPPDTRASLVHMVGREHLDAALSRGRGAVVVSGHLGSWELLAATLVREGFPLKVLARSLREPRLDHLLTAHRLRMGVETFKGPGLPVSAIRHLRSGGLLGIVMDHRLKRGGVEVTFLGQATRMADGPARIARAAACPLIPMGIHRLPDHRHRATVLPPVDPSALGTDRDVTQVLARSLERLIAAAPEQWMWIHPRWGSPGEVARSVRSRFVSDQEGACAGV